MAAAHPYAPPRTSPLALRFFWKECRRLAGLAIGLAVIAVMLILFVKTIASERVDVPGLLAAIAVGAGAMLAVAAAVTIFAAEKEEGTADFLSRLPQNPLATALGKVTAAGVVVVGTTIAMLLTARLIEDDGMRSLDMATLAQQSLLLLAEAFVWGLVASLVCPNPLVAAVLGILAASASSQLAIFLTDPGAHSYTVEAFVEAAPARAMLVAGAALVAGWLASRWPAPLWRWRVRGESAAETAKPQAAERAAGPFGGSLGVFGRLVWQTLRQSWLVALGAVLLGLFLTFVAYLLCLGLLETWHHFWFLPWLAALFAPALLGAVVFRADQRRGAYRFLAEHAGRPRMVWLARNATWLTLLVVVISVLSSLMAKIAIQWFQQEFWYNHMNAQAIAFRAVEIPALAEGARWLVLVSSVAAYAFGQYFSLSIKSDVIAAMLAMLAAVLLAAWGLVVWAWWLPTNYFVAVLALFPLVASWLRAPDWMFDRRGWWRWVAPMAALMAPIGWIAWATPGTRLGQLVDMSPTSAFPVEAKEAARIAAERGDPAAYVLVGEQRERVYVPKELDHFVSKAREESLAGRTVRDAYERLAGEVEESKKDRLSAEQFAELDRLSRLRCRLPIAVGPKRELLPGRHQEKLAILATRDDDDNGRLERLLVARRLGVQEYNGRLFEVGFYSEYLSDELLDWATTKDRNSEEILSALEELRKIEDLMLRPSERLMNHYRDVRAVLTGEEPFNAMNPPGWLALTAHESLPFERERSFKALDALAALRVAYLDGYELTTIEAYRDPVTASRLPDEMPILPFDDLGIASSFAGWNYNVIKQQGLRQLRHARTSYLASLAWGEPQLDNPLRDWQRGVAWRRAERVRLALVAYRIDHDEYPMELDALAPDYLAAGELHDLYSGQPMGWEPKGFDLPLALPHPGVEYEDLLPKGTPVLWSGGPSQVPPTQQEAFWDDAGEKFSPPRAWFGEAADGSKRFEAIFIADDFVLPLPK